MQKENMFRRLQETRDKGKKMMMDDDESRWLFTLNHFDFQVLYIGKVRISQRKVPESLIDDALNKFAQHEAEKALKQRRHSLLSSTGVSKEEQRTILAKDVLCDCFPYTIP